MEILFQTLILDLGIDKQINECGWINSKEIENTIRFDRSFPLRDSIQINQNMGIRLNIIDERNSDCYSIKPELKEKIDKNFNQYAKQLDYLLSLKNENYKLNSSNQVIQKIFDTVTNSHFSFNLAVFYGLLNMFENSGLPAPMVEVLAANLNPKQWNQISQETMPSLAFQLVRKRDQNITISIILQNYEKLPVDISRENLEVMLKNSKNLEKVERILQWSKIKDRLGNNLISALGVNWFILNTLETIHLLPYDQKSIIEIHKTILSSIETLLKININEVFADYDSFIEFCETENVGWGTEIITFPEVV